MFDTVRRAAVFALYQASVATGILLLPVALLTRRLGLTPPVHRVVGALGDSLEAPAGA
jgi:hypothetical protein